MDDVVISELCVEHRALDVTRQVVRSKVHPGVSVDFTAQETVSVRSLLAGDFDAFDEPRVVDHERATLATGDVFRRVEGIQDEVAVTPHRFAVGGSAQGVTVVFDDDEVVRVGDATNRSRVRGDSRVIHKRDCASVRCDSGLGLGDIDVPRSRVDVDEHGCCSSKSDRQPSRRELVRRNNHFVARSEIGNDPREFCGIGSRRDDGNVSGVEHLSESLGR